MRNPLTLLAELPALAAEVFLTRDAPNPAPRADRNIQAASKADRAREAKVPEAWL